MNKVLVVYDEEGNIIFTQSNANSNYRLLVADVNEGKDIESVDPINNKVIFRDAPQSEIDKTNEQLQQLQAKVQEVMAAVDVLVMGGDN